MYLRIYSSSANQMHTTSLALTCPDMYGHYTCQAARGPCCVGLGGAAKGVAASCLSTISLNRRVNALYCSFVAAGGTRGDKRSQMHP